MHWSCPVHGTNQPTYQNSRGQLVCNMVLNSFHHLCHEHGVVPEDEVEPVSGMAKDGIHKGCGAKAWFRMDTCGQLLRQVP